MSLKEFRNQIEALRAAAAPLELLGPRLRRTADHYVRNSRRFKAGLKRMFLHAARIRFVHPASGEPLLLEAPLPRPLADFVARLGAAVVTAGDTRSG